VVVDAVVVELVALVFEVVEPVVEAGDTGVVEARELEDWMTGEVPVVEEGVVPPDWQADASDRPAITAPPVLIPTLRKNSRRETLLPRAVLISSSVIINSLFRFQSLEHNKGRISLYGTGIQAKMRMNHYIHI
jgi:hypothetical protein